MIPQKRLKIDFCLRSRSTEHNLAMSLSQWRANQFAKFRMLLPHSNFALWIVRDVKTTVRKSWIYILELFVPLWWHSLTVQEYHLKRERERELEFNHLEKWACVSGVITCLWTKATSKMFQSVLKDSWKFYFVCNCSPAADSHWESRVSPNASALQHG